MLRIAIAIALLLAATVAEATEAGWALLRQGGKVVLVNHARAPGTGDPARFDLEDCATQRNLSDEGRQQARRMGALFYARAAPIERVLTSRYCRASETAEIAFRDSTIEPFAALDEFTPGSEAEKTQTEAVLAHILGYSGSGNLILVTHTSNIEALAGIRVRPGEAVILSVSEEAIRVAGRISFD